MRTLAQLRARVRSELRESARFDTLLTGSATVAAASTVVNGTATDFTNSLQIGDEVSLGGIVRTVRSITSDTALVVNKAPGELTGAPASLVQRQGGWTDEELDNVIAEVARNWLAEMLARFCPAMLQKSMLADLTAGQDMVSVPTGMRRVDWIEVQAQGTTSAWIRLRELPARTRQTGRWYMPQLFRSAGQKGTGLPSAWSWRDPGTIELDMFAPGTVEDALQFWGRLGLSPLADETDVLAYANGDPFPDGDGLEGAVVYEAAARLLSQTEATAGRAGFCKTIAAEEIKNWIHGHSAGRSSAPKRVRIVNGY